MTYLTIDEASQALRMTLRAVASCDPRSHAIGVRLAEGCWMAWHAERIGLGALPK